MQPCGSAEGSPEGTRPRSALRNGLQESAWVDVDFGGVSQGGQSGGGQGEGRERRGGHFPVTTSSQDARAVWSRETPQEEPHEPAAWSQPWVGGQAGSSSAASSSAAPGEVASHSQHQPRGRLRSCTFRGTGRPWWWDRVLPGPVQLGSRRAQQGPQRRNQVSPRLWADGYSRLPPTWCALRGGGLKAHLPQAHTLPESPPPKHVGHIPLSARPHSSSSSSSLC